MASFDSSFPTCRLDLPEDARLEFITDVEGNWEYFNQLIARSEILSWSIADQSALQLDDSGYLVFGGDAPDKGTGDIRVVRTLLRLHQEYPTRVFLLVGNRDTNKLRLAAELVDGELPDKDPVSYLDTHNWEGKKQQFAEFLSEKGLERSPFNALRWILEKTMGGATLIQTRRKELEILGQQHDDHAVLKSFADSVSPSSDDPWMLQYMRAAHIMLIIGDCLFVHGAILSRGLLLVPAEDCRDGEEEVQPPPLRLPDSTKIDLWASDLNSWKSRQLRLFEAFPQFRHSTGRQGEQRWRGGAPLMLPSLSGCHVVTDGFLKGGNCAPLDSDVAKYLGENGIRRVFTGHQPQGQSPGVIRCPEHRIVVVMADTSFSDTKADKTQNPANNRGGAISTVSINRETIRVHGVLADGTSHIFELHTDWNKDSTAEALIGCRFQDASWGKTIVNEQLLRSRGKGFDQDLFLADANEARTQLDQGFHICNGH